MIKFIRRCQAWTVGHDKTGMVFGVEQCHLPATRDGLFCDNHKDFPKIESWLPSENS